MKKFDEIGQIRSDWAHIENPDSRDRVLDSPGGFGQFFRKIGGKMKIRFFRGEKKIFESIAKTMLARLGLIAATNHNKAPQGFRFVCRLEGHTLTLTNIFGRLQGPKLALA